MRLGERAITPLGSVVFSEDSPNSASMSRMAHRRRPRLRLREEWDSGSRIQDSRTLRNWHIWPGADPRPLHRPPSRRRCEPGGATLRYSEVTGCPWARVIPSVRGITMIARVMGGAVSVLWVALAASGSLTAQGPQRGAEGDDIEIGDPARHSRRGGGPSRRAARATSRPAQGGAGPGRDLHDGPRRRGRDAHRRSTGPGARPIAVHRPGRTTAAGSSSMPRPGPTSA